MAGPLPKPAHERRRVNAPLANTTKLPAGGSTLPPPDWPLPGEPSPDAVALWAELWATPPAVAWRALGWTRTVARYVLLLLHTERDLVAGRPSAPLWTEIRQIEDRLGLNPQAMVRLRWEIDGVTVATDHGPPTPRPSAARRLKAVDSNAVARGV